MLIKSNVIAATQDGKELIAKHQQIASAKMVPQALDVSMMATYYVNLVILAGLAPIALHLSDVHVQTALPWTTHVRSKMK